MNRFAKLAASTVMFAVIASAAHANVIAIPEASFTAGAGLITFSEKPIGTNNPTYTPADYGGGAGAPTVTFGGFFLGQSLGNAGTCPAGAALTGCVVGNPTGPLTLDPNSPATFITTDGANPTSPVLSGSPTFNGAVSILFDVAQAGVGLDGGFFDAIGSTGITAFDANGNVIGTVSNTQTGIEFLGLVTSDHSATIKGLQFHLVGDEPAGFAVDNIRFGVGDQVITPGGGAVPEPATWAMMLLGFLGLGAALRRRKQAALAA
jgi:hypothetical protein